MEGDDEELVGGSRSPINFRIAVTVSLSAGSALQKKKEEKNRKESNKPCHARNGIIHCDMISNTINETPQILWNRVFGTQSK